LADYTLVIKAVDQTQGTLRGIEGNLGKLSGAAGVASRALGVAAVAAAAVGAAIGAAAVKSVQAATEIQNLGIRLSALTGSAQGGAAALDTVRKAAENLPFSLQEISQASPALLTVSKDTDELRKNIQLTADLAAVTGLSFQETAGQLQRAFSAGANSADLFRERGVLALAGFQAGATVSVDETRKKFEELGQKIAGTANELNKTLPGAISQLQDQLFKLQTAFGQPITEALASGLNVLVADLNATSGTAQEAAKVLGQNFALAIADAIDFVALIIDALDGLYQTWKPLIDIVITAAKVIGDVLVRAFGVAGAAVLEFTRALGVLTDAVGITDGLADRAAALQKAYVDLAINGARGLGQFAKEGLGAIAGETDSARTSAKRYSDAIRESIAAQRAATSANEEFGNVTNKNFTDAQTAAQQYLGKLNKGVEDAKNNLAILLEAFKRTADFSLRIKYAEEIANLQKQLGLVAPTLLTLEERLKLARNQYATFAGAQEAVSKEADRLAQAFLAGDISLQQYLQTATKVNDAFKTGDQLRADAIAGLQTEAAALEANKTKLQAITTAYIFGSASIEQYIAALEKIPESVRTPEQVLLLLEERFKQQQTIIANQLPALAALRQQYELGAITAEDYQRKVQGLSAAIEATPKSITDVVAAAEAQAKANRRNITLQGELNQRLADGKIKYDEYRIAAQNLGIPEGEVERNINAIGTVEQRFGAFSDNVRKYSQEAATNFSDSFVTAILEGKNALNSFKDFFGNILKYIAAQILKAQIADPIAKALSGAIGGIFGGSGAATGGGSLFGAIGTAVKSIFGGFFADGGVAPGNKVSVVGERGPELFVPGRTGTVVPNDALGSNGDTINVNFSINAVDTQTGVEFLMKNKQVLTSVIEQAYNRKGRRGPVSVG
jgi:hypothetical protein